MLRLPIISCFLIRALASPSAVRILNYPLISLIGFVFFSFFYLRAHIHVICNTMCVRVAPSSSAVRVFICESNVNIVDWCRLRFSSITVIIVQWRTGDTVFSVLLFVCFWCKNYLRCSMMMNIWENAFGFVSFFFFVT